MDPYLSRIPGGDAEYLQTLPAAERASVESSGDPNGLFGKDGMTFHDVLNIINPLQQLPVIGTLYREITGDELKPGSRLIGGLLFGGPVGLASAVANVVVEYNTGHDIGGEVLAMAEGKPLVTDEARARVAANEQRRATVADTRNPGWARQASQLAAAHPAPIATEAAAQPASAPAENGRATPIQLAANVPAAAAASFSGNTMPAGLASDTTGLSGKSGLPSAGTITPAAIVSMLGQPQQPGMQARGTGMIAAGPSMASPAAAAAAFPSNAMPAGLAGDTTGLSGKSGLPSAGTITPAAVISMLGQQQQPGPQARGTTMIPAAASALPVAAAIGGPVIAPAPAPEQQAADQAAQEQAAETATEKAAPSLRMPVRLSIAPRMPAPAKINGLRTPVIVPPDAIAAAGPTGTMASPGSDAPIILGTPNATPASLTPTGQIPDAMLRALDKYDALIKNRRGGGGGGSSGKMLDQAT